MSSNVDTMQRFGKDQMEQISTSAAAVTRGFQALASETADYSKRSLETTSSFVEKMFGVKSVDTAMQIQSEFAKTSFESFIAQANKVGEIYKEMAKEAFRPVEAAMNKGSQVVQQQ